MVGLMSGLEERRNRFVVEAALGYILPLGTRQSWRQNYSTCQANDKNLSQSLTILVLKSDTVLGLGKTTFGSRKFVVNL